MNYTLDNNVNQAANGQTNNNLEVELISSKTNSMAAPDPLTKSQPRASSFMSSSRQQTLNINRLFQAETSEEKIENISEAEANEMYCGFQDNYITFSYSQFLEAFLWHIFFFSFPGPIITPILLRCYNKYLLNNMEFNIFSKSGLFQTIQALLSTAGIWTYFMLEINTRRIQVILIIIVIICRTLIVSLKYGNISKMKYELLKRYNILKQHRVHDQVFGGWAKQEFEQKAIELGIALRKHEIDVSSFYVNFKVNLKREKHDLLMQYEKELKQGCYYTNSIFGIRDNKVQADNSLPYYSGMSVVYDLINLSNLSRQTEKPFTQGAIISFLILSLSFFLHIDEQNTVWIYLDLGDTLLVSILNILNAITSWFFLSINYVFMKEGYTCLSRNLYIRKEIAQMLRPKSRLDSQYPIVNFFDPISLRAWSSMRKAANEYGYRFSSRLILGMLVQMVIFGSLAGFLFVSDLLGFSIFQNRVSEMISFVMTLIPMAFTMLIFIQMAQINYLFMREIEGIQDLRNLFSDLQHISSSSSATKERQSPLLNYAIDYLKERFQDIEDEDIKKKKMCHLIKTGQSAILDLYNEVKYQQENQKYTVLGININFNVMRAVIVSIAAIISDLVNSYSNNVFKKTQFK